MSGRSVSILGGGSWGTALAVLLTRCCHRIVMWEFQKNLAEKISLTRINEMFLPGVQIPDSVIITSDIEQAIEGGEYIIFAVPSHTVRSVARQISSLPLNQKKFISTSKGIENESLQRMSEIILNEIPSADHDNCAVLSGPSFAAEVACEIPTAVVAASYNISYACEVQALFMCPSFRVYINEDVAGVEYGGAFKNVVAIATGIVDGVGFGDNSKAALLTRAMVEITRLGVKLGADAKTFSGLSGMGDLILTCMGKLSRNLYVGQELGKGRKPNDILQGMVNVAEGVKTAQAVRRLSEQTGVETPIMEQVYRILFEDKNLHEAAVELMTREPKTE